MKAVSDLLPSGKTETRVCEIHGEYKSTLFKLGSIGWTTCAECMQERIRQEDLQHTREVQERARQKFIDRVLGRAAIPPRFADRTLTNFRTENEGQQRAYRVVTKYLESWENNKKNGTSIIFCGNHGTGKTHLAVGMIKKVIELGDTAVLTHVLEYTRAIKQSWTDRNEREVMNQFVKPDLLVIDEVGHQYGSDAERLMLFDLINARYMEAKPMILITNLQLSELKAFLDERAQDRLREGGGTAVVFDWESQRK